MTAPRRLGKYELIAKIGEGGMAEVHLARQRGPKKFQKLVVVKTVHPKLASKPALAEALLDEARIAALVKHPNVVDIYDLGEEKGTYFIAMEYLEGESLAAVLTASRAGPRLDPFSTARIIADCAAGLHAAHELRDLKGDPLELVHQDVTPGNVIVLYTGTVKLVDFGVAKVSSSGDAGLVKGKAGYLAPELFDGAEADRRSDVWALGVVLWEALTLRRLFGAKSEEETFARIRNLPVEAPSRLALAVTRDLDEVCMRALARAPAARYPNAKAMHDDLIAVLRGANWSGDSEPIARFMRTSFATQIAARREVLRELAAREELRPEVLERMRSVSEEPVSGTPPGAAAAAGPAVVVGSHASVRLPLPAPPPEVTPLRPGAGEVTGGINGAASAHADALADADVLVEISDHELIDDGRVRRRKIAIGVGIAALATLLFVVLVLPMRGSGKARIDAGLAVAARDTVDAAAEVVVEPIEVVDAGEAVADVAVAVDGGEPAVAIVAVDAGAAANTTVRERERERDRGSDRADPPSTSARSLYKEGLGKFVAGDTGGAIGRFQAALDRDPRYAPAHRGLGMAYERKGERSRAARSFRTYLSLAPNAADAAQIRARLAKL